MDGDTVHARVTCWQIVESVRKGELGKGELEDEPLMTGCV